MTKRAIEDAIDASMGPQPFGCGRSMAKDMLHGKHGLQWGRNLSVAEGGVVGTARRPKSPLQWGRNLSVAEGAARAYYSPHLHGFNGAATFRLRKGDKKAVWPPLERRFNGAATFRLRKGTEYLGGTLGITWLQWGRNLSVAEGTEKLRKRFGL